ncbi:MAG: hypothetical protein L0G99_16135 [Propionibacteriales bacterium]|nr:hypothetical protein [Propionibacteriales bacterium]
MQDPGRTLGVVGLVFAFLVPPVGLAVCHLAKRRSGALAFDNTLAKVGSVIALVLTVLWCLVVAMVITLVLAANFG